MVGNIFFSLCILMHHCLKLISPDCRDGDVLLMNGSTPTIGQAEGRVEICYGNLYRTICDDYWDVEDAQVICRQLNFTGTGKL